MKLVTNQEILNYYGIDPSEVTPYYMEYLKQLYYFARLREQDEIPTR